MFWVITGREDLDFAFDDNSISAFSARPGRRKHLFGVEERYIGVGTLAYKAEALDLQKQLRHIQSQFDMHTGQASSLIQGRRARVAATSTVNGHLTDLDDSLSARNLELKLKMKLMIPVLWLQFGCLHAISTILESVSRPPQLFAQVEPTLVPIMRRMLTSDGQVS